MVCSHLHMYDVRALRLIHLFSSLLEGRANFLVYSTAQARYAVPGIFALPSNAWTHSLPQLLLISQSDWLICRGK